MSKVITRPTIERHELKSLQAGRAIAALLVCAFHLSILLDTQNDPFGTFISITWWGYRGVDFFFVLSGFIILFAHRNDIGQKSRTLRYIVKRVTRVYPIYWFYTGVVITISAFGSREMLQTLDGPDEFLSTILLIRFGSSDPTLGVAWTLFHEIIFYAGFATLIAHRLLGIIVLTFWLVAIIVMGALPSPHTPAGTFFSPYNLNFFFGMLAYCAYRLSSAFIGKIMIVAGVSAVISLILINMTGESIVVHVGFAGAFALLIAGFSALERTGFNWKTGPLLIVGDASYSLYLIHATMQAYLLKILLHLGILDWLPLWIVYLLIFAGVIVLALVIHIAVEKPLIRLAKRALGPSA